MIPEDQFSVRDFLRMLNRRRSMIIAIVVVCTLSAGLVARNLTPVYTAEATLLLDTRKTQVIEIKTVMSGLPADMTAVRSELDILNSGQLARQVVEQGGLLTDPEFVPATAPKESQNESRSLVTRALALATGNGFRPDLGLQTAEAIEDEAIDSFHRHLHILNDGRSYAIRVAFESTSPEKAARIANLTVKLYIDDQLEAKQLANERANTWLNERIGELREEVRKSDTNVQEFRAQHQLIESRGATVSDQQLSELNTQLILARTERAQAEARLKRIHDLQVNGSGLEAAREVLSSGLIQRLREQESDLLRREAELAAVYDDKHPKMINIRAEMADFKRTIREEIDKVALSVGNDVAVARSREVALAASLDEIERRTSQASRAEVELKELQRDADANRTLFQTFLNRSKETGSQEDLLRPDARVISNAMVPRHSSSLGGGPITGLAFLVSFLVSTALAILLERLDNRFVTSTQLHQRTGLSVLGMVPEVTKTQSASPLNYALEQPRSAFCESLRSIRQAARSSNRDHPPKIMLVTSSIVGEGKTTFCAAFASLAARSGRRVLAIDCDSRCSRLQNEIKAAPIANLGDILLGKVEFGMVPMPDCSTGCLDLIAPIADNLAEQDVFASPRMAQFLSEASKRYDLIIMDTPPVMAVSVAPILAPFADLCLYIVRWDKTSQELVASGLGQLEQAQSKSIGLVLSRVDLRRHRRLGYGDQAYYYGTYGDYYSS